MVKDLYENLPDTPGVYLMKNKDGKILYIGKAANLRRRVSSYFTRSGGARTQKLISEIGRLDYKKTDSALEALILEASLIKEHQPPFNILEKDDKSFFYVEITNERFPRVLLVRGMDRARGVRFGPFTSTSSIKRALKILRKIFPWHLHPDDRVGQYKRPCFDAQVGLCPGVCVDSIPLMEYKRNIRKLRMFFEGRKKRVARELEREMRQASKNLDFERAESLRRQVFALRHIHDVALISRSEVRERDDNLKKIEGYDVSNISGTSAVGAMVVFVGERMDKDKYRKFKVRTIKTPDDTGMLREVLGRRFSHPEWSLPDLVLIDGGNAQVNAARGVLAEYGLRVPVVGIAKGSRRKKNEIVGQVPPWASENVLVRVRDEAHRFAIKYHREVRRRGR